MLLAHSICAEDQQPPMRDRVIRNPFVTASIRKHTKTSLSRHSKPQCILVVSLYVTPKMLSAKFVRKLSDDRMT